jgi:transposase
MGSTKRQCPPKQVALALGLRYCAVTLVLRQYLRAGGELPEPQPRRPWSRPSKITPELATHLLAPATLEAWRGWSMARRVHAIQRDWGINISRPTLAKLYRKHGIRKMLAPFRWSTPTTAEQRAWERREWVIQLVQHLQAGHEVVYIDETSVSVWDRRLRTWMYRDQPIPRTLAKDRGHSITVLGAISTQRDGLVYGLSHSTNAAAVQELLRRVFRGAPDRDELVVVWDNHGAHRTVGVQQLIIDSGATSMPLPVNSSDLNPIERVWAQLKPKWHNALYQRDDDLKPEQARELLDHVLRYEVVPKTMNYAHGGRDILIQALHEYEGGPPVRTSKSKRRFAESGGWKPYQKSPGRWQGGEGARRGVQ